MTKPNTSTLTVAVLAVILAYPLSLGPVMQLAKNRLISPKIFVIYQPLFYCAVIPGFKGFMRYYLGLWGVEGIRQ